MDNFDHFDYIIIGHGLAGLQLALAFSKDAYFDSKKICLIDPSKQLENDKTWSFWERGYGHWDHVVEKKWSNAIFESQNIKLNLSLENYHYKTIRAADFYRASKAQLLTKPNFTFIEDTVIRVEITEVLKVISKRQTVSATHVFDSRIPKEFSKKNTPQTLIHQHFKGWLVETEHPTFNTDAFTMMDYRYQYNDSTSFFYVLPYSETKALFEYTFFTPFTVSESTYDRAIENYLQQEYNLDHYKISEVEIGNIPMTDFPFWKYNSDYITKIGTGGGWVKGSTGYSFKHTEKNVAKIVSNIKKGRRPSYKLENGKFKFYDKIFLKVLYDENQKGVWIFERFYSKNSVPTMFQFLDEETRFGTDVKIMKSLFSFAFIKAFFKVLFRSN